MGKYYDINKKEEISLDLFVHQIFSLAVKRLKLKLNKGYDPQSASVQEVLSSSNKDDENYRALQEFKDGDSLESDYLRFKRALENELAFEDDVLIYMMQIAKHSTMKESLGSFVFPITHFDLAKELRKDIPSLTKARIYSSTADKLLMGMAFGVFPADDFRREFSQECYGFASALESSKLGRWNGRALVHHKLERKFNRYFGIIAEAAEAAYQSKSQGARGLLTPPPTIDDLLDKLNTTKDEEERNIILRELKERKN